MPEIPRVQLVASIVAALVVAALGVRWIRAQSPADRGASQAGAAAAIGTSRPARDGALVARSGDRRGVLVHVAGAVRSPGVYRLRGDARVRDAVRRAGGATRRGDANAINLAARIVDGQQVVVPARAPATTAAAPDGGGATPAGPAAPDPPVNLNTATLEQLDTLEGVGPATAQKILDYRRDHGGFGSVEDLGDVPGIGPKRLAALREKVQV